MYCATCGWFYNPNQKCGCYRDKDGKVIRKRQSETDTEYRNRCFIVQAIAKATPTEPELS